LLISSKPPKNNNGWWLVILQLIRFWGFDSIRFISYHKYIGSKAVRTTDLHFNYLIP